MVKTLLILMMCSPLAIAEQLPDPVGDAANKPEKSRAGVVYQLINISGVSEGTITTRFNQLKEFVGGGVFQNSAALARRSLDNTKMILTYRNPAIAAAVEARFPGRVIGTGNVLQARRYLELNNSDWNPALP